MVRTYSKAIPQSFPNSKRYQSTDFDCHCDRPECLITLVDDVLVLAIEELIAIAGEIVINDGFRCAAHNKDVGGVPGSQHTLGKAVDIKSHNLTPKNLASCALKVEAFANGGIGAYNAWVHVDTRGWPARWGVGPITFQKPTPEHKPC